MRIIIAGTAFPFRGGLAAFNERLARQFIEEGHNTTVVTFILQYPGFLFPGKTQYLEGPPPATPEIIPMMNSVNPINWFITGRRIRRMNPDILIFKYWLPFMAPCFGTIARIVRRNPATRIICIFDNVIPHEKRPGDRLLTRWFLKSLHAAIAMSEQVKSDFSRFRPAIPVKLSPHPLFDNFGADPGRETAAGTLNLNPGFRYLLFFGFIRAYKGLDLLLEAFATSSSRTGGKIKLIVAGEFYENDEPYRRIIRERNMADDVILFDRFIRDEEVSSFFSLADLVVQPYRSATQSGVTQIAYHFNKPMVVTGVGGLREIVPDGKCGLVVSPEPVAIADAIDRFFVDARLRERLAGGIEEEKKRYGWNLMTGSILEMYGKTNDYDNKK
jgi:glycosyltransferase involved in cell wall biosynthesis